MSSNTLTFRIIRIAVLVTYLSLLLIAFTQASPKAVESPKPGTYRASIIRVDGREIIFNLLVEKQRTGKARILILNADERMEVRDYELAGDSIFIEMPFFESRLRARLLPTGHWEGVWVKGTTGADLVLPLKVRYGVAYRFPLPSKAATTHQVTGRWEVIFTRTDKSTRPAIAELVQEGTKLKGSFLTPSGDYRFLEGVIDGDSLRLSCFDGSHAYLFAAHIDSQDKISGGSFWNGSRGYESWSAVRNENAELSDKLVHTDLVADAPKFQFSFRDIDGNLVSYDDERFRDKVLVVQIMGSWCPNCMDETQFLSEWYKKNKNRGVEIVSFAYEYSTDEERSRRSLRKFRDGFDVTYPMLITGITSQDPLKASKTIPQISDIKVYPTTVFVDRNGVVRQVHSGFFGPGTGVHHTRFVEEFEEIVSGLLNQ